MQLLPGEHILRESGSIVLTNFRVRKFYDANKNHERAREMLSIRLECVTHCHIVSVDYPILLLIGFLFFAASLIVAGASDKPGAIVVGLILGGSLVYIYFSSRYNAVKIASPSATITFAVGNKEQEWAIEFIDLVEYAVIDRLQLKQNERPAFAAGLSFSPPT